MKKIFFTPGPAELYPSTIKHFQNGLKTDIASLSHRSKFFQEIFKETTSDLKKLLSIPDEYFIFFTGSGTEALERTIQNCVEKYSFHFVNGAFSKRFYACSEELGKKPSVYEVPLGEGFNLEKVVIPQNAELLCFTHNESSAGVMTPLNEIQNIARKHPDTLMTLDIVSSVPYGDIDFTLFDAVIFSVQKGFGLPAGMGVMIVSPRALQKAESLVQKGVSIGSYHGFPTLAEFAKKNLTPETPPVLHIYVLGKVIKEMLSVGVKKIQNQTEQKAKLLYEFLDRSDTLRAIVQDQKFRSQTIIVVDIQKVKGDIKKKLAEKGIVVGSGYGVNKDTQIRIANFPTHSITDIKRLIKELKAV